MSGQMRVLTENYEVSSEQTAFKLRDFELTVEKFDMLTVENKEKTDKLLLKTRELERALKDHEDKTKPQLEELYKFHEDLQANLTSMLKVD
jgi:hypothetical protein